MSKNILTVLIAAVLFCTGMVSAVTYVDDFNRPDGELDAGLDWQLANGSKNWHLIDSNSLKIRGGDPSGADNAVCDVYVGALHAGEGYQRASIDYMPRSNGYIPQAGVHLNFNGSNHYYFAADSYRLSVRGTKDMQVVKLAADGTEEITSNWHGFANGDLTIDTWYRLTIEKNYNYIIGTVTSQDGQTVYGVLHIIDTGVPHTGGWVAITDYYGLAANSCRWDNFEYELLEAPPAVDLVYTDDFNRANGELQLGSDWEVAHGGKNWHLIDSNSLKIRGADPSGADNAVGDVYVGSLHAGEPYQRVSIDYMPRSDAYAPQAGVHLNFDGRNDYFFAASSYRLSIRGNKDMQVAKLLADRSEEYTSGWHGFIGGDLTLDTWYRLTLERDENNVITGTVTSQDGQIVYGRYKIIDTNVPHTDGWVAITDYYGVSANSCRWDNFEYEIYRDPGPFECKEPGTVYQDSDLNEDCYVTFEDVAVIAEQWLSSSDPTSTEYVPPTLDQGPSYKLPRDTSIVVDGDLSDWPANAEWIALDQWYYKIGNPNDVTEAKFSARWDDANDVVYVAVMVDETVQYFASQHYGSDTQDCIEVYSQGNAAGGTGWSGEFDVAQQYRTGPDTDTDGSSVWNGGQWSVWGTGEAIAPAVGFVSDVNVTGSVTTYELAIPQFDSYEGISGGGSTVVTQLDVGDVVGLDIIAFTIDDFVNDYGFLSENMMTGKWNNADQFAKYTLVEDLNCGDVGYLSADIEGEDCCVNFADFVLMADQWFTCTDPNNEDCDQYWDKPTGKEPALNVTFSDDFNRPDGELMLGSDWTVAHGGKNWHLIDSNSLKKRGSDPSAADEAVGDVYVGYLHAGESYQRVSIDYMPRSDAYAPQASIHLNFDGRDHYFFAEKSYRLSLRGNKDMQVAKLGAGGVEEFTSGWNGFSGGALALDTWVRLTLERDGNLITGTVTSLDGLAQYGQLSITDTGVQRTGGWVAITDYYGVSANSVYWDNFEYEVGSN